MTTDKLPQKHRSGNTDRIAILGTVGVPGRYGGFESLAENLVHFHEHTGRESLLTVYCSGKAFKNPRAERYGSAKLRYISLSANGIQSIPYDVLSIIDALRRGENRILLLGVSGALCLPLCRVMSKARFVTNIDGIEWKRAKWNALARFILRMSEWAAVRFSHDVIADNQAIADYVVKRYRRNCEVITYGGDHAILTEPDFSSIGSLPDQYALALCRIEPENNVHTILEAWAQIKSPLVFVGNWANSSYGQELKSKYDGHPFITCLDPIYEPSALRAVRERAVLYVHGHSAGGTNPSLVEMMQFGIPVVAWDCDYNRYSTDQRALFFGSAEELVRCVGELDTDLNSEIGDAMREIAQDRYLWSHIGEAYFSLLEVKEGH